MSGNVYVIPVSIKRLSTICGTYCCTDNDRRILSILCG